MIENCHTRVLFKLRLHWLLVINISMKYTLLTLFTIALVVYSQTTSVSTSGTLVGNYRPYTDLTSLQFQQVLNYIYAQRPEVKDWTPQKVGRQLVAGYNWYVYLVSGNSWAQTVVYERLDKTRSITSFKTDKDESEATPAVTPSNDTPIVGGFQVVSNPSGPEFEFALREALRQNPSLGRDNLVRTERQVVAGANYRFRFQTWFGNFQTVNVFVPLNYADSNSDEEQNEEQTPRVGSTTEIGQVFVGGYRVITDRALYIDALRAVYRIYPQYNRRTYVVEKVARQVVTGFNYRIKLINISTLIVDYAIFQVYIDLEGQSEVQLYQRVSVRNFSLSEIQEAVNLSYSKFQQLDGFRLYQAENIANGDGLRLTFTNDEIRYRLSIARSL